jgi:hypothetical protein
MHLMTAQVITGINRSFTHLLIGLFLLTCSSALALSGDESKDSSDWNTLAPFLSATEGENPTEVACNNIARTPTFNAWVTDFSNGNMPAAEKDFGKLLVMLHGINVRPLYTNCVNRIALLENVKTKVPIFEHLDSAIRHAVGPNHRYTVVSDMYLSRYYEGSKRFKDAIPLREHQIFVAKKEHDFLLKDGQINLAKDYDKVSANDVTQLGPRQSANGKFMVNDLECLSLSRSKNFASWLNDYRKGDKKAAELEFGKLLKSIKSKSCLPFFLLCSYSIGDSSSNKSNVALWKDIDSATRHSLGAEHPFTAISEMFLAQSYEQQGLYKLAIPLREHEAATAARDHDKAQLTDAEKYLKRDKILN